MKKTTRRQFINETAILLTAFGLTNTLGCSNNTQSASESTSETTNSTMDEQPLFFSISLAQWSLHRAFQANELDPRDFASIARKQFDIGAVEYVNSFYPGKAEDSAFLQDLKQRADDHNVKSLLIMVDEEGDLGHTDDQERLQAVENHYKWVDAAKMLGCHSIRVNGFGEGSREAVRNALADGMSKLAEYAQKEDINVVIENHGLYTSDAQWVASVIKQVNMPNCGTLPDFGNFCMSQKWGNTIDGNCTEAYDYYQGVKEMLPFAKGVSAKSYDFDEQGQETTIDYQRMLKLVKESGFTGYIGIEYEGSRLSEVEGIKATHRLLVEAGKTV